MDDADDAGSVELTILMPCLNEAETIATCISRAQNFLRQSNTSGEILIADNGSSDGSIEIAERLGVRVVRVPARGYGAALIGGIAAARGKYVIMGDADDSYDFSDLGAFLHDLRAGYDLVMGNRFGGGVMPGAMPLLHYYLGNPVLSLIGRVFFRVPIQDFHCGLRGFRTRAIRELGLRTTGMEFASEMVVRSGLSRLRITEVPTTLRPGGRTRAPHLKTWSDGWRHFKFLLMYSPKWLFFAPGLALAAFGLLLGAILMFGPVHVGPDIVLDLKSFVAACLLGIVGIQLLTFGALARFYATITGMLPPGYRSNRLVAFCTTDRLVTLAVVLLVLGAGLFGFSIYRWAEVDFGRLEDPMVPRLVAAGLSIMIVAVQIGFSAFLFGILAIPVSERSLAQEPDGGSLIPNAPTSGSSIRESGAGREALSILSLLVAGAAATVLALLGVLRLLGLFPASAATEIARVLPVSDWIFSADPDLLMLIGLATLGVLVGARYGGRQNAPAGLFWGCAFWFAATTNAYFLGVTDYSIVMTPDSPTYLYYNACRTPGYLALLTPFKQIDARWLVAFQLNLVVASQVAVAWAVSRLTASALAGVLSLAIATLFSHLDFLAFFVMSEAMFASAVGFAAAAAIVYVKSPSTWCAAVVGLSIAVALTVKAVAPAMAIVALLALLRPAADARIKALAMLGPPVVCLVGLAGLGRVSHGAWSPTNFGGYALAENVAWGIRNDSYSTDPKLSAAVEEKLQVFQHRWPAPTDVNAYLARSIDNLDAMFWDTMVPIVAGKHGLGEGAPHCPREVNASLTALGIEAIRRDPLRYAAHAAVQFYGLWGFALPSASWSNHARQTRRAGGNPMSAWNWRAAPSNWRPTPIRLAAIGNGGAKYDANGLFVDRVKRHLGRLAAIFGVVPALLPRAQTPLLAADPGDVDAGPAPAAVWRASIRIWQFPAVALAALTIAFAALGPWIRRLPPEIAALALLALLINAYFAAHALFMFASVRYAASVEAPLAAFLAIVGYVTATTIVGRGMSRFRRPSSLQTASQPS